MKHMLSILVAEDIGEYAEASLFLPYLATRTFAVVDGLLHEVLRY